MTDRNNKDKFPSISHSDSNEGTISPVNKPEIDGYQVIGKLGEGGMGTVWRALQLSTHREVALKVMGSWSFGSQKAQTRFEREVDLTARLNHPNIARIYDSGINRGLYYYAMELIEGQKLDDYVRQRGLTQRHIMELISIVCDAIKYAHQLGVIHRDLKPSNIIVTSDGQPHILDFGMAKTFLESDVKLTVSVEGDVVGTPAYMSPEQAAGYVNAVDTRSDLYSLGMILYNLSTNQWPYVLPSSYYEALKNIQEAEPVLPSKIIPGFDADIEAILLKALAKLPSMRYQSIGELSSDIKCWLDGLPISARSIDTFYLLRKFAARHRTTSIIASLLLVIIISTCFISLYSYGHMRSVLGQLQLKQRDQEENTKRILKFANQVVFNLFLELWHGDKIDRAKGILTHFTVDSQEKAAAIFLLDPRELVEKEEEFRPKIDNSNPSFWQFILGEYHLKHNNKQAAIDAYKSCIAIDSNASELDDWFKNRAKRNLAGLTGEKSVSSTCPSSSGNK